MNLPYNPKDKKSVIDYAKLLKGKTLRQICGPNILEHNYTGKGNFGQILEKFYFGYDPNSKSEADFFEVGMELKTSPLKQLKNKEYRSKERLVLNIINYIDVVNQEFEESDFWKKNANILLIFYLHQAGFDILDYLIKIVDEWNFPSTDLEIIKNDWELIKRKIADGKAHELSEGDTFYLGACTKGGKGGNHRRQPFSETSAKQRAYSLKTGYVNHIIASIAIEPMEIYGKLIPSFEIAKKQTIEEIVIEKFKPYYGRLEEDIIKMLNIKINAQAKSFYANLTKAILGVSINKEIEEFQKADIEIKTIRVEANNTIEQSVSFPAFEFEKIYTENWLTSDLNELIEGKFLFIFFKNNGKNYYLDKVRFWNMPYSDRQEVRKVWLKTKKIIQTGNIIRNIKLNKSGKPIRYNNFPKKTESRVSHIRPHGKDSNDTYPLPVGDLFSKEKEYTKQCFWLNWDYVRDEIYLK